MYLNKDRRVLAKAVAIIASLQGIAWLAISILGIVVYYNQEPTKMTQASYDRYIDYLSRIIYDEFIRDETRNDKVIRSKDFVAFLWIYCILSALWIAASLDQYTALRSYKKRQIYMSLLVGILLLLTSIIDLIFVGLLARDLNSCAFHLEITPSSTLSTPPTDTTADTTISPILTSSTITRFTKIDCQLANGIVMTIAARGYILWCINVVLGISLIVIAAKVLRSPPILKYENNGIPRVQLPQILRKNRQQSPSEQIFLGDSDIFGPIPQVISPNRPMPMALNNKNKNMFY